MPTSDFWNIVSDILQDGTHAGGHRAGGGFEEVWTKVPWGATGRPGINCGNFERVIFLLYFGLSDADAYLRI